jgi:hypothetical protein
MRPAFGGGDRRRGKPGSVARAVLENLIGGQYRGRLVAVHPRGQVIAVADVPLVADVPGGSALAVVRPAEAVPGRNCRLATTRLSSVFLARSGTGRRHTGGVRCGGLLHGRGMVTA